MSDTQKKLHKTAERQPMCCRFDSQKLQRLLRKERQLMPEKEAIENVVDEFLDRS
jgi:hypothetical protein